MSKSNKKSAIATDRSRRVSASQNASSIREKLKLTFIEMKIFVKITFSFDEINDRLAILVASASFAGKARISAKFFRIWCFAWEATARLVFSYTMRIFRARLWLSVKVDVHINNNGFVGRPHPSNGHAARSSADLAREPTEHAYEQICVRQEETSSVSSSSRKKPTTDNASDSR